MGDIGFIPAMQWLIGGSSSAEEPSQSDKTIVGQTVLLYPIVARLNTHGRRYYLAYKVEYRPLDRSNSRLFRPLLLGVGSTVRHSRPQHIVNEFSVRSYHFARYLSLVLLRPRSIVALHDKRLKGGVR